MCTAFDIVVEVLTVILGVVVLLLGWQVVPRLSFLLHRRAAWVFSVAAVLFLVSEFVEMAEALRPSGPFVVESRITIIVKDISELLNMACVGVGVYLLYRAERKEVASLRRRPTW